MKTFRPVLSRFVLVRSSAGLVCALALLSRPAVGAEMRVDLAVNLANPGASISEDFLGLSFETQLLLPGPDGRRYFRADNRALIALFRQLGIKSLRVGGNTADRPTVAVPGPADIDSLFAFAEAADVKVIYTLRLRAGNRDAAAGVAKYIYDHHRARLECFAIGNEPNVFAKEYPVYRDEWRNYVEAITAPTNAPEAKFCGPSATPGKVSWARDFAADFGKSSRVDFISQHDYPGGAGNAVTNAAQARDRMLSGAWVDRYAKFYHSLLPPLPDPSSPPDPTLPIRIEEVNNFYNGGAKDVSDTFAAALWGLDYLRWWASLPVARGVNFHTGDQVAAGENMNPCRYAAFWTSESGYHVHPLGYGMKAFALGGRGRAISLGGTTNLTAYAVESADKSVFITLINKEHGANARDAGVTLAMLFTDKPFERGKVMFLSAPNGDVAARSGVTLGGAEIKDDGSWKGDWTPLGALDSFGRIVVKVPAASAAIVELSR